MKIRMITTYAGPDGCVSAGRVKDIGDLAAIELVDRGFAEFVDMPIPAKEEIETAELPKVIETAAKRTGRRGKK